MAKRTGFYEQHVAARAKIVEFAGYDMPIQYHSMVAEHKRVRQSVGVFDVSHMGEVEISGPMALDYVQKITINDAAKLAPGEAQYSAMCKPDGGIVDDLIVYRRGEDHFLLVINAANIGKDFAWIEANKIAGAEAVDRSDFYSQLAVQGPQSIATLQKLTLIDLNSIAYYKFSEGELAGAPMLISHTGYTGETGFELYFDRRYSESVWRQILAAGEEFAIEPIGLGARDSLRLEKGYALYGNDIDESTSPLEARLGWICKLKKGDFLGRDHLQRQKETGIRRRLSALLLHDKGFPRHGYEVFSGHDKIGYITSGTVSPMLNRGIAMAYLDKPFDEVGSEVQIDIRGKQARASVVKLPFV
jgi:aminomethyltransferase